MLNSDQRAKKKKFAPSFFFFFSKGGLKFTLQKNRTVSIFVVVAVETKCAVGRELHAQKESGARDLSGVAGLDGSIVSHNELQVHCGAGAAAQVDQGARQRTLLTCDRSIRHPACALCLRC